MPQQCMLCSHATAMHNLQQLQGVTVLWPGFRVLRFTVNLNPNTVQAGSVLIRPSL